MKVYADKVYEWPSREDWVDGEVVEFAPIDNQLKEEVGVVVGEFRKKYRSELQYWCDGDGGWTCGGEGWLHNNLPSKRTFIAIRYTLTGRRYYTTKEYLKEAQ